jgi:hypothetical protein
MKTRFASLLFLLLMGIPTRATVTVVQTNKNSTPGTVTSLNVAYSSNNAAHNTLLGFCYVNLNSGSTNGAATDTAGNTWVNEGVVGVAWSTALVVFDSKPGANTVTFTAPGTNFLSCVIYEISGLGTSPTIQKLSGIGTSAAPSATGGTAASTDWIFAGGFTDGGMAMSAGTGYILPDTANQCGSFGFCSAGEYTTGLRGTVTATFHISGSTDWGVYGLIFTPSVPARQRKQRRAKPLF